jgi:trehalose/maltose hydrolase-like predicted phosphorylase
MFSAPKYGWEELEETGCVAWALEQQFWQSGDRAWMQAIAPVLRKIAAFFASRVVRCVPPHNTSHFCLNHVMGPDESHAPVNNSAFTSGIAAASIATAVRACKLTGEAVPANWSEIADHMYIPFDAHLRYHPEFEGFKLGTVVRQADVQLLQYPLHFQFPPDVANNDIKNYEKSINGPAMTYAMFACMYLQQHDKSGDSFLQLAQVEFEKSFKYVYGDFHSFSEGEGGGGTPHFATGMGAFLQSIVQGWAGVRYTATAIAMRPQLPLDGTTNLTIAGIHYHNSTMTLSIVPTGADLVLAAGPSLHCNIHDHSTSDHAAARERIMIGNRLSVRTDPLVVPLGATVTCRDSL